MTRQIEVQGQSVDEALVAAAAELGVGVTEVEYEVLDEGSRKRFGLGTDRPASVRAWVAGADGADEARELARELLDVTTEDDLDKAGGDTDDAEVPEGTEVAGQASDPSVAEKQPVRGADWETPTDIDDAELDRIADVALEVVREILKSFDAAAVEIEEYEGDEGEIILDIVGAELAVLIGRHGRTLDSLQSLVSTIVNRKLGFRYPVIVDIEGYRHRRRQKVESIALSAAERAVRQNTAVRLRPMVAGERRAVHMALRGNNSVVTESEGQEPNRLVVIKPAR